MSVDPSEPRDGRQTDSAEGDIPQDLTADVEYDPGETLSRAMNLGCSLALIAFALVSCGFIVSVLSLHR